MMAGLRNELIQPDRCPGAESNHRHGDFQSLQTRRDELRFPLWTSAKHTPRPVKVGTPKHGHARSSATTAAGDEQRTRRRISRLFRDGSSEATLLIRPRD